MVTAISRRAAKHEGVKSVLPASTRPVRLMLALGCLALFGAAAAEALFSDRVYAAGDEAASSQLTAVSLDGIKVLRKQAPGEVQLVNFWATWCASCVDEIPELIHLSRKYSEKGLKFVMVSANGPSESDEVRAFLTRFDPPSRNLIFDDTDTFKMMKAFDKKWSQTIPYTAVIDRRGEIVFRHEGRIDSAVVEEAVRKALGG